MPIRFRVNERDPDRSVARLGQLPQVRRCPKVDFDLCVTAKSGEQPRCRRRNLELRDQLVDLVDCRAEGDQVVAAEPKAVHDAREAGVVGCEALAHRLLVARQ